MATPTNIQNLNQKLETVGLDPEKYNTEELTSRLGEVIIFPSYAAKKFFTPPVLMAIVLLIGTGVLYYYGHYIAGTASLVTGFFAVISAGMVWGAYNFTSSVTNDLESILTISLEIADGLSRDLMDVGDDVGIDMSKCPGYGEILLATNTLVVIPVATSLIKNKIPILGGMAARLVRRMLFAGQKLVLRMLTKSKKAEAQPDTGAESFEDYCKRTVSFSERAMKYVTKVATTTRNTIVTPQKIFLYVLLTIFTIAYATILWFTFG